MNKFQEALEYVVIEKLNTIPDEVPGTNKDTEMATILMELYHLVSPIKPLMIPHEGFCDDASSSLCCSNCKMPIINVWNSNKYEPKFCHNCGQKIDWSDEK